MNQRSMPRHEVWRLTYRKHRYCQHLSQLELNQRVRDIFLTMLTLTPEAMIVVLPITTEGVRWFELWTHALEEAALRGSFPAELFEEITFLEPTPDLAGDLASKAATKLLHLHSNNVAIKFGSSDHMRKLYECGAIRIQAASFYRQPNFNGAIRDDELSLDVSLHLNRDAIVKIVSNPEDVPASQQSQRLDINFASITDYWLYCVTTDVGPRLFVDFEAQACVVIKDLKRFTDAMQQAVASKVGHAEFRSGAVTYIDPALPSVTSIDVPMSKHFRYSHQHEHRFVWLPREPTNPLMHLDVELGSLKEYAELIFV